MANKAIQGIKNKIDSADKEVNKLSSGVKTSEGRNKMDEELVGVNKNLRYQSLIIEGTKYRTLLNRKFENRKNWNNPDPKKVISYIPGTVVKVFIREGQQVEQGDSILILEAMKMKNRIVFSRSGKVKSVNVSEGEKVPKDYVMIELE